MWNPIHFAVYYGHLPIVKYIISLGINVGLSVHKSPAESEKDPTNTV
jgi:ankyrin repeat protein